MAGNIHHRGYQPARIAAQVEDNAGSAIQMAAGYEGLGKGTAESGGSILFDVYVQHIGSNNSFATHFMQWSHVIDYSGDKCKLD